MNKLFNLRTLGGSIAILLIILLLFTVLQKKSAKAPESAVVANTQVSVNQDFEKSKTTADAKTELAEDGEPSIVSKVENRKEKTRQLSAIFLQNRNSESKYDDLEGYHGTPAYEMMINFNKSIQEQNWQEALKSYSELTGYFPIDDVFLTFILEKAPLEIIEKFLELGMPLSEQAMWAVTKRDVSILKGLLPHGLDVHSLYLGAFNGLNDLSRGQVNRGVFDYLLEQGVSTQPIVGGVDSLDSALMGVLDFAVAIGDLPLTASAQESGEGSLQATDALYFVEQLIDHGEVVGESHLELLKSIQVISPSTYQELITAVPELSIEDISHLVATTGN